jgi:hypothetical protein
MQKDKAARIAELEHLVERRDEQIAELKRENGEALELLDSMREQVKDSSDLIDRWIETFRLQQNENGVYVWSESELWNEHRDLYDKYRKLLQDWNKFVVRYNGTVASRDAGRPLAASPAQVKDVLRRRGEGASYRAIASATSLSVRTVRTIVEKDQGTDRTAKRRNLLRKREFDRLRAADYRARHKAREALPKAIAETRERGEELLKAAKGLGR